MEHGTHGVRMRGAMSNSKRDYVFRMRVHDAIGFWEFPQYLAVDEALAVALGRIFVDGGRVPDPVGIEVADVFDEGWGAWVVGGDDVLVFVQGVAD